MDVDLGDNSREVDEVWKELRLLDADVFLQVFCESHANSFDPSIELFWFVLAVVHQGIVTGDVASIVELLIPVLISFLVNACNRLTIRTAVLCI